MHDCVKTSEQLIDLIFDELAPATRRHVLAELEGCHHCLAQYQSMTETLRVFDQVATTAVPSESYWPGYEARLRTRLQHERPSLKRRLSVLIGGLVFPAPSVPLAAGLALLLLALGWWSWQRRHAITPAPNAPEVAQVNATPEPKLERQSGELAVVPPPDKTANKRQSVGAKSGKPYRHSPLVMRAEPRAEMSVAAVEATAFGQSAAINSLFNPPTARHFEKAQLLLRSFRNVSVTTNSGSKAALDLAYEKQLSRRLLYQNILLRRDAELKGNLPAEEALSGLEPFLLDIANLPDKPSPDELHEIRERLQRKALIAALQIYAAHPAYQSQ